MLISQSMARTENTYNVIEPKAQQLKWKLWDNRELYYHTLVMNKPH